jgi:hypothetical protein
MTTWGFHEHFIASYNQSIPRKRGSFMSESNGLTVVEMARDIRSGMTDFEMGEKYRLTPKEFHLALHALIDSGLVTKKQLEERQQLSDSQIIRAFIEAELEKP